MAIEVSTGRLVVVAICDPARLDLLAAARGVSHRHLLKIIDVLKEIPPGSFPERVKLPTDAGVAVAEHAPGKTLRAMLDDGPLHAAKAVAWALRLADALQALHGAGAVHGAVSPRSVLAAAEGRAIAPVLSQLLAPTLGAFCPPERLRGSAESASDDVWALYATLYAALTGKPPFSAPTRDALLRKMGGKPPPLSALGVEEPALQEILARGLTAERRGRATDLSELVRALDGWERDPKMMPPPSPPPRPAPRGLGDIVGGTAFGSLREDGIVVDDSVLPDDQGRSSDFPDDDVATVIAKLPAPAVAASSSPGASAPSVTPPAKAPLPQAQPVAKRPSINPFERKGNVLPWLLGAAVIGAAVIYLLLAPGGKTAVNPVAPVTAVPSPPRPLPAPATKKNPELLRDECVVAHFEPDSFEGHPDFSFVCADGEFRETARRLYAMAVVRDPADAGGDASAPDAGPGISLDVVRGVGAAIDGGAQLSRLGWYELPATAIIRKSCCSGSAPVVLPETPGWCEQLQAVVRRMADDSSKSVDLAPGARNFDKAVACLYAQRVRHGYAYDRPPAAGNRALFQQFLGRAAIISTKR